MTVQKIIHDPLSLSSRQLKRRPVTGKRPRPAGHPAGHRESIDGLPPRPLAWLPT